MRAARPNLNLVSNVGFGADATNTDAVTHYANLPTGDIGEVRDPEFVVYDGRADLSEFRFLYGQPPRRAARLKADVRRSVRRLKRWVLPERAR